MTCRTIAVRTKDRFAAALAREAADLIVSDYQVGGFDAISALTLARSKCPEIPFVIYGDAIGEEQAVEAIKRGAADFVLKGNRVRFVRAIWRALNPNRATEQKPMERLLGEFRRTEHLLHEMREQRGVPARVWNELETERKRVAQDLHDSAVQTLSFALTRLQAVEAALGPRALEVRFQATDARKLIERSLDDIRRIAQNLMPGELEDLGLVPAVESLCREFQRRTGLAVDLKCAKLAQRIEAQVELCLFRIIQEALSNVEKHSNATRVALSIQVEGGGLRVTIEDNGAGTSHGPVRAESSGKKGMGLSNMSERAAAVGGNLEVVSAIPTGTTVRGWVPSKADPRLDPKSSERVPHPSEDPNDRATALPLPSTGAGPACPP